MVYAITNPVLSQHWNSRPGTREQRRGLSPRVACKNTWAKIEALQRNQVFIDRYRDARADHLAGRKAILPVLSRNASGAGPLENREQLLRTVRY